MVSVRQHRGKSKSLNRPGCHMTTYNPQPCMLTPAYSQFRNANQSNMHVFGLWEVTSAPGENPRRTKENTQTPHGKKKWPQLVAKLRPRPTRCEAAVVTTTSSCCLNIRTDWTNYPVSACYSSGLQPQCCTTL